MGGLKLSKPKQNKMLLMVEGSRCVGKTYLINQISDIFTVHKFPFVDYYKSMYEGMGSNNTRELFFFTAGYDVTLLDMYQKGITAENMLVDRSFMTNIVFGVQSGRINMEDAVKHLNYVQSRFKGLFHIIYVDADLTKDNRNKDAWEIYNQSETNVLYEEFLSMLEPCQFTRVKNKFDKESVKEFFDVCIQKNRA
jgi:thymidylate kinase